MQLPEPIDGKTKVLRDLLTYPFVSFKHYPTGFRLGARIWDLRNKHSIDIATTQENFTNEYGNEGSYAKYSLVLTNVEQKISLIEKYKSFVEKPKNPVATKEPEPALSGSA